MIDAKELRVGNYVSNGIHPFKANIYTIQTAEYGTALGEIEPIPLTEEMLLKCGFVVTDKLPNNILSIDLGNDTILFEDLSCDRMYIRYYNEENNFDDFDCMSIPQDIHSLHQLQNLYFALTGQELNVEL